MTAIGGVPGQPRTFIPIAHSTRKWRQDLNSGTCGATIRYTNGSSDLPKATGCWNRAGPPATASQGTGIQRETARRKRCDRLFVNLSRRQDGYGTLCRRRPRLGIMAVAATRKQPVDVNSALATELPLKIWFRKTTVLLPSASRKAGRSPRFPPRFPRRLPGRRGRGNAACVQLLLPCSRR